MTDQVKTFLTAEEFRALPESSLPTELIEGELIVRGSPSVKHQIVTGNTFAWLRHNVPGGQVFIAPLSVYLDDGNFYQPAVMWVAPDSQCYVADDGLNGAPDLVVEVLSPGTAQADRGTKFRTYQRYGVREYWMIDTDLQFVEVWSLVDRHFEQHGIFSADDTFTPPLLDHAVSVESLFVGVKQD